MDRREAIEWLKDIKESEVLTDWSYDVALDLAIKALCGDMYCPSCGVRLVPESEYVEPKECVGGVAESATTTDCISRQQAIEALTGWQTEPLDEDIVRTLNNLPPVTPTEQDEEDILKFYYVESLDEYWIGQRCGTRYYGKWTGNCFTFEYSRYLPWGEHVVAPDTLWKEHTYPSEPKEIPFNEWLQGFLEKECQTERTGEWIVHPLSDDGRVELECPECGATFIRAIDYRPHFCENCGADMRGEEDD